LNIDDLVTVRLIIATKEDLEFVHLKDMSASCLEPVEVLPSHQYHDKLAFYKSTKDTAPHFFFEKINKGNFSNGITTS